MSQYRTWQGVIIGALCIVIAPLRAHHSTFEVFDMKRRVSVTGTLTKVDWINPHIVIVMESRSDDGGIHQWRFESNPPSWYRSVGLARADLERAIGQTITVEGMPAKSDPAYGYMQRITALNSKGGSRIGSDPELNSLTAAPR